MERLPNHLDIAAQERAFQQAVGDMRPFFDDAIAQDARQRIVFGVHRYTQGDNA